MTTNFSDSRRYTIQSKIGQGGMGAVYHAFDRLTRREVALKTVLFQSSKPTNIWDQTVPTGHPAAKVDFVDQDELEESLLHLAQEFQILATLRHPHIISVYDYGFTQDKQPYFTMDFLEDGLPLDTYCELADFDTKIKVLMEILMALIYLHRRQILHRDLKPRNVLISNNKVKVLDFGLASLQSNQSSSGGTLAYLAPELLKGGTATVQSDLYAVGVIAYELFADLLPFDPAEPTFLQQVLREEPEYLFVDAPPEVIDVIGKLLAKRPSSRFSSAEEALIQLARSAGFPLPIETVQIREAFLQNARFIGREAEIDRLSTATEQLSKKGTGRALLIGGESGVGKSRLLTHCKTHALVEGLSVFEGEVNGAEGSGYQLWSEIITRLVIELEVNENDLAILKVIAPKIEAVLDQMIPDPPSLPKDLAEKRLINAIVRLFSNIEKPSLFILEDLHWHGADTDLLDRLLQLSLTKPFLFIGTFRNDEAPELPGQFSIMEPLILERFSPIEIAELSQSILGDKGLRPEIQKMLQTESEGNVFFLVEVVRALAEITGKLDLIETNLLTENLLPKGIQSIVENRLHQVPAAMKTTLVFMAIAGRQIDSTLLSNMIDDHVDHFSTDEFLLACSDAALLELYNDVWRFSHDKLRQGIIVTVDQAELPNWHQQVALALEDSYPNDHSIADRLVTHWAKAGSSDKEIYFSIQASNYYKSIYKNQIAFDHISHAIDLSGDNQPNTLFEALKTRESLCNISGKRAQQLDDIERLEQLVRQPAFKQEQALEAEVLQRKAIYHSALGEHQQVIELSNQIIERYSVDRSVTDLFGFVLEAQFLKGQAFIHSGKPDEGIKLLEEIISSNEISKYTHGKILKAKTTYQIALSLSQLGRIEESHQVHQEALLMYQQLEDPVGESNTLYGIGILHTYEEKAAESIDLFEKAYQIFEEIGDVKGQAKVLSNLHITSKMTGKFEEAVHYGEKALNLSININSAPGKFFNLINLMWVHYSINEIEQANQYREIVQLQIEETNNLFFKAVGSADVGLALLMAQNFDLAEQKLNQALAFSKEIEDEQLLVEVKIALLGLYQMTGNLQGLNCYAADLVDEISADPSFFTKLTYPFVFFWLSILWLGEIDQTLQITVANQAMTLIEDKLSALPTLSQREDLKKHLPGLQQIMTFMSRWS
ncbi:MAG: protein kinase [Chloroflexota bacterium]